MITDKDHTFFVSDPHFFHGNIIKYCNRPFKDVGEMNEALITNWNNKISKEDNVFLLGDLSFGKKKGTMEVLDRLNGRVHLILGNHDYQMDFMRDRDFQDKFIWIKDFKEITILDKELDDKKVKIILSHYPMRAWPGSHRGSWQLHGHTHGTMPPIGNQLDIGVDTNGFMPYSYEDVKVKITQNAMAAKK